MIFAHHASITEAATVRGRSPICDRVERCNRDLLSARATENHLFLTARSCLPVCCERGDAYETEENGGTKSGHRESESTRRRRKRRRRRRYKASYRGGAGPDGIALPVSCLSRHVLAGPTRNRPDYLDDSFLVLIPIHEVAPGLGCPRRHRVSREPDQCRALLMCSFSLPPSPFPFSSLLLSVLLPRCSREITTVFPPARFAFSLSFSLFSFLLCSRWSPSSSYQ